jgi:methylmalonyl-CoA decarboxylase subunit alpha
MTHTKSHQSELERLAALEKRAELGGGQNAIDRHHAKGKLTARERLNLLFDPDSFVEINKLAESQSIDFGMQEKKVPGDGVITGYGTVDGRLVFAYAQDVTVLGGSVGTIHGQKICRLMDEALKVRAPLIALNDSGGGRLHEGFFASKGVAGMFYRNTAASGIIPQITGMMGSSAGVAVYSPALTDFIVMVKGQSHMVITGPVIIKSVTGEEISLEELGGAKVHSEITGQAHFVADNDRECIETIKKLLGYLPSNKDEYPPIVKNDDDPDRTDDTLEKSFRLILKSLMTCTR